MQLLNVEIVGITLKCRTNVGILLKCRKGRTIGRPAIRKNNNLLSDSFFTSGIRKLNIFPSYLIVILHMQFAYNVQFSSYKTILMMRTK